MEEAISMQNSSIEYYKYLSERVEKSPLSFSGNQFFPELSKKEEDNEKAPAD